MYLYEHNLLHEEDNRNSLLPTNIYIKDKNGFLGIYPTSNISDILVFLDVFG